MGIESFIPVQFHNDKLTLLDQTRLPGEKVFVTVESTEVLYDAIKRLVVRGAPAIGVAAGYGMWIAAGEVRSELAGSSEILDEEALGQWLKALKAKGDYLIESRPTAVNLEWAVRRVYGRAEQAEAGITVDALIQSLLEEAHAIRKEDEDSCYALAENGLSLLEPRMGILTHCNAGVLATAGYGTALAPLHLGQERGYGFRVFTDETRPLLQGARLSAWELQQSGVDVTLICDNMASLVMKKGWVDAIVVGCDRMAANGDGANKIGTSAVAILAKHYGIPFYMFVPTSTIDLSTETGDDIVIEERDGEEIRTKWYEKPMGPEGVGTFNPAFDVTDHDLITAIVTERGVVRPPFKENLAKIMEENNCTK